jgi:hypothetical protein
MRTAVGLAGVGSWRPKGSRHHTFLLPSPIESSPAEPCQGTFYMVSNPGVAGFDPIRGGGRGGGGIPMASCYRATWVSERWQLAQNHLQLV